MPTDPETEIGGAMIERTHLIFSRGPGGALRGVLSVIASFVWSRPHELGSRQDGVVPYSCSD